MSVARHVIAALEGTEITPTIETLIHREKILGFILFRRNIKSVEQLLDLNATLKSLAHKAGYELLLAVDQEGGRVARLVAPDFSTIPPLREWGRRYQKTGDPTPVYRLGRILATEVKHAGFNLNFAPVVDLDSNPDNPIIGDRSFSADPQTVLTLAEEMIRGHTDTGVIPCLKHFPGHGATTRDSHLELPYDHRNEKEIQDTDLAVYQGLIEKNLAPTLMTAHVIYSNLDKDYPATLSQTIIGDILRNRFNYDGVIFSDDMLMKAVADHYPAREAVKRFFLVGGDAVIFGNHPEQVSELITDLNGTLAKQGPQNDALHHALKISQQRIQRLLKRFSPPHQGTSIPRLRDVVAQHKLYLKTIGC